MTRPTLALSALLFALTLPALAFAQDSDGDGVPASQDCDDNDAANYPGNTEACDGQDNDCNGVADFGGGGGPGVTWTQSGSAAGASATPTSRRATCSSRTRRRPSRASGWS